nr:glycosyltransferase family 39 protein [Hydrogenivirga sp. 128-5-R1-1]
MSLIPLVSYNLLSVLFLTDTVLMLFYVLSLYYFYKILLKGENKDFILWSLFSGCSLLSKQVFIALYPVFLFLAFIKNRKVFKMKIFYFSLTFSLLIGLVPFFLWNLKNDFATFKHLLYLSGAHSEFKIEKSVQYLGDYSISQIAINSVFLFPLYIFVILKAFKNIRNFKILFLLSFPVFVFLFFLILSFKHRVYGNWPAFSYFTLYILAAFFIYRFNKIKHFIILSLPSILSIFILFYTPILDKIGIGYILPPKKDPTKRLVGWRNLALEVQNIRNKYREAFLFSDDYFISSELMFYLKDHPYIYCINTGRRKNQFDFLGKINNPKNYNKTGIYITGAAIQPLVKRGFKNLVFYKKYNVKYRGKVVKSFNIYVLRNFKEIKEIQTNRY